MHPRRLQRGALSIALAGTLLVAGGASAQKLRFQGWTPLSDYVSAGLSEGGTFRLTVPTREGETEVALHPVDVNASDYHAEEAVQNGARIGRRRPALHTFAGSIEKTGSARRVRHGRGGDFARLSREANGRVSGLMRVDGVLYDLAADSSDLVLQVNEVDPDELAHVLGSCGGAVDEALAGAVLAADATATSSDTTGSPSTAAAGMLHEVELGTEADAPFVTQAGGVSEANARIASIVNAINGIYEFDLGLTLKVAYQRAWNGSDPYTSTDSDTLLSQFRSNFLSKVSAPTDDVALFSGRDFDGNIVGRAWVSSACSDFRFGVVQFYQQSDSLTRLIGAHELGHTLGASHSTDGGIMAPSINPNVTWFSATSQQQIADYVSAVTCLAAIDVGGAPVIDPIGPQDAPEGALLSLQLSATDPEGGAITWSALPLPIGATMSPSGLFQWTPPLDSVGCGGFVDHSVTFYATDPDGNRASETVVISVLDTPTGTPPAIAGAAERTALSDRPLSIPLSAGDPDGDTATFAPVNLPVGASLSPSGMLTWTPSYAQIGPHDLTFTATDCTGKSSGGSVTVDVVSSAPHLTSITLASGGPGQQIGIGGQNLLGKKVRVYFGPKKAKAYAITDTSLLVLVPKKKKNLPATLTLSVLRDGVVSDNTLPFTYTPQP